MDRSLGTPDLGSLPLRVEAGHRQRQLGTSRRLQRITRVSRFGLLMTSGDRWDSHSPSVAAGMIGKFESRYICIDASSGGGRCVSKFSFRRALEGGLWR